MTLRRTVVKSTTPLLMGDGLTESFVSFSRQSNQN